MIKVSVIIPVYNMEKHLAQCLDSIQGQTLKDIEIICVDDGSTDASLGILHEREKADPRLHVYTQKNSYAGVARNNGITHATGEYLLFMDSDDFVEPDMLESMYNQAVKTDADICACLGDLYHDVSGVHARFFILNLHLTPRREVFRACDLGNEAFRFVSSGPPNKLIRRALIEKHQLRFQPLRSVNDLYFIDMCVALARRITVSADKVMYHYRVGQTTNLQSVVPKNPISCVVAATALKEGLTREGLYPKMKAGYDNFIAFEIERYAAKLSPFSDAFGQLHDWYREKGKDVYDIQIQHLDAGTLSNLLMTFEGAKDGMTSEEMRTLVIRNKEKYAALYEGHKRERARFLRRNLVSLEGAWRGNIRWLALMTNEAMKKIKNRG